MTAAVPLFATKGFDALTTKEIADAAGVSEALLYRHFDSKQALFHAVQDTCVAEAAAEARRLESLPDNTSTLVLAVYVLAAKIQDCRAGRRATERNELPRLLMRSLLGDGEFAQRLPWPRRRRRGCARSKSASEAAIAAGDLRGNLRGRVPGGLVRRTTCRRR